MATEEKESLQYGDEVVRIEPKGIEHISDEERHGKVSSVFTLWFGANVELATLTTGVAAVAFFGLNFTQAAIGLLIGNVFGVTMLGLLSTFGPRLGVPQMVHSRAAYGFFGNFIPGFLNMVAGVLWFAVNTILGAFAFDTLFGTNFFVALLIMVIVQVMVAVYGYNMIHAVERFMAVILTLVFIAVSVFAFGHANYHLAFNPKIYPSMSGAIVEAAGLAFSYLLGWTVFASDYTRYLSAKTSPRKVFWNAASSNFIACLWLELVGAALAIVFPAAAGSPNPMALLLGITPHWLVSVTLLAVIIGTVTANVLNIYSGSLSALVVNIPVKRWLAAVLVGLAGGVLAYIAHKAYYVDFENFLFLLGYWLSPWVAVVLMDFLIVHRGRYSTGMFYDPRRVVRPGLWAWLIAIVVSIPFFDQTLYTGFIAHQYPQLGDLSYYVSFVVAGLVYVALGSRRTAKL
ncbi:MAG: cytosine permease [Sulfobacillus benefaciens]|uniref:Cytosine permease n=1 Tax=Sulfobacillus benefaciens TaxID=453960 RepID=A0A2T2XIM4_9FIRM|nr:MAG: cytosine permease [Sulfobacillus benefaciens]